MRLRISTSHQGNHITLSFATSTQQLTTNLNIRTVPDEGVFNPCSVVFIVIPMSFVNFSNLVDAAPDAPTATEMTDTFIIIVIITFVK